MRFRILAVLAAVLLGLGAGAAVADVGPSSEGVDEQGNETNQVDCNGAAGEGAQDVTVEGVRVAANGSPETQDGYAVVCHDGDNGNLPIQGRAYGAGNSTDGGQVCIDGDADNAEQLTGWACVGITPAGPALGCATEEGTTNSEHWQQNGLEPATCEPGA